MLFVKVIDLSKAPIRCDKRPGIIVVPCSPQAVDCKPYDKTPQCIKQRRMILEERRSLKESTRPLVDRKKK